MSPLSTFKDCYYSFQNGQFSLGNSRIERSWSLLGPIPLSDTIQDKKSAYQWLDSSGNKYIFDLPFFSAHQKPEIEIQGERDDDCGIAAEHLKVSLFLTYETMKMSLIFRIYPDVPLVRQELWLKSRRINTQVKEQKKKKALLTGMDENAKAETLQPTDYMDVLPLSELHCRWKAVSFRDVTDTNNNLLHTENGQFYINENRKISGNLLFCKNLLGNNGLLLIKESPTAYGQLHYPGGDYHFTGACIHMTGSGISAEDLNHCEWVQAYGTTVALWSGEEFKAYELLQRYHRCIRKPQPQRDFFLMSNNWGDRSKDGRVSEPFVLKELDQAAKLGIKVYQIDDGWQQGNTTNSVQPESGRWSDYYADDIDFWSINRKRFPNGLDAILKRAEGYGIALGLWFSPDSIRDFENWEKDSEKLLELYQQYGIAYFKLDGIKIRSKCGEENLINMMRKVVQQSSAKVYFNLDVTNEIRLGYFGRTQYGGIFLENRYTDFRSYYPHLTLRNLWLLSAYVPAQKLQIEFLNVDRNQHVYENDPLAPASCGVAYAFAAAMAANPLAWMELTGLSESNSAILQEMVQQYNELKEKWQQGFIYPIGEEPTGVSWTGFQSIVNENEGYILVFRELAAAAESVIRLWDVGEHKLEIQSIIPSQRGMHQAVDNGKGNVKFYLSEPLSFALYHYTVGRSRQGL